MRRALVLLIAALLVSAAPSVAKITYRVLAAGASPFGVTSAFDNADWFTESGADKVLRVMGSLPQDEYPLPSGAGPLGIAPTSVGTLVIAAHGTGSIDELSPDGSVVVHPLADGRLPYGVTNGPDGETWFTAQPPTAGGGLTQGAIERLDVQGHITPYPLTAAATTVPWAIVGGPDGNLWFTEQRSASEDGFIGRITPSGEITEFSVGPGSIPTDITVGTDNNLWFTDQNHGNVGRITTAGQVTEFAIGASSQVMGIAKNAYDNVVVADPFGKALFFVSKAGKARKLSVIGSPLNLALGYPQGMWLTMRDDKLAFLDDSELIPACRVPNVVGYPLKSARKMLGAANCKVGRVTRRKAKVRTGTVVKQRPASGRYAPGYGVALTVSR